MDMMFFLVRFVFHNKNPKFMKNIIILFGTLFLFSCQSIKKFNQQLTAPIAVDKLQKDVDYSYQKLKQLHPKLYWYISKEKLDYKFDSLKKSYSAAYDRFGFL